MKTLEQVRDELAEAYMVETVVEGGAALEMEACLQDFRAGFDAAVRTLAESAGEWPGVPRAQDGDCELSESFRDGARWQWEADRARIGLAEQAYKTVLEQLRETTARAEKAERAAKSWEEVRMLETKLAAAEAEKEQCINDMLNAEAKYSIAMDKLEKAEARVRELETERDKFKALRRALEEIRALAKLHDGEDWTQVEYFCANALEGK